MLRSIVVAGVLCAAVLWAPVWVQVVLFVCAIIFFAYRLLFVIPAIWADILYAPTHSFAVSHAVYTICVLTAVVVWLILINQTRISDVVPTI